MKSLLIEFLNKIVKEGEPNNIAQQAKAQGLTSFGFGRWGKKGKVTHLSKNGKLVPFKGVVNLSKIVPKSPKGTADQRSTSTKQPPVAAVAEPWTEVPSVSKGKNKVVQQDIQPSKTQSFTQGLEDSNRSFYERNREHLVGAPFHFSDKIRKSIGNGQFPRRYIDVIERMVSSKLDESTKKWSFFTKQKGGQGATPAQAGEIMALMGLGMSDVEADAFYGELAAYSQRAQKQHPDSKLVVDVSWIAAAKDQREGVLRHLAKKYGDNNYSIISTAWDVDDEVTAIGLSDYKKNKGFSSDIYLRVERKGDGQELVEISLKKSLVVNFSNGATGSFLKWDASLKGTKIDPNVYAKQQKVELVKFILANITPTQRILQDKNSKARKLIAAMYGEHADLKAVLSGKVTLKAGRGTGSHRRLCKLLMTIVTELKHSTNSKISDSATKFLQSHDKRSDQTAELSLQSITSNPKLKRGMIEAIRTEFPLKSVSEGEEVMSIGPYVLDRPIMEAIFGTNNYDVIKDHLIVMMDPPPPYIAYRAEIGGKVVPIAGIRIREDGKGYGGQFKFETKLDPRFAKILKVANSKIYGYEAQSGRNKTQTP